LSPDLEGLIEMPEFPRSEPVTADVRLAGGSLDVYAEPRDTVAVEVTPYDSSDASREAAENTRVELSGDTLLIAAPEAGGWLLRRSPKVRVNARVPSGSTGRLRVASADVTCHGEWAQVKLNTASGDAYVEHVTGDLSVNSASGDVRAAKVDGRLTVNTASGDISARQVAGGVEAKSASGDVEVDDAGGEVSVKTASGDTHVRAARRGSIRVSTVSGDTSVGVVTGTAVWMDLNTMSGRTRSDLDMAAGTGQPPGHDLTVQVRSVSGDIELHRVGAPTVA
jgi:hypothetical protein